MYECVGPRRRSLVTSYLEGVSWRVFEEYPGLVRDLIRGESGVYALYKGDRIYYVGLTQDLRSRLKRHLADRHQGAWDRFSVYVTRNDKDMRELEALLIRIVSPQGNRQVGRFAKSKDMGSHFVAAMKEADADKRARLLGVRCGGRGGGENRGVRKAPTRSRASFREVEDCGANARAGSTRLRYAPTGRFATTARFMGAQRQRRLQPSGAGKTAGSFGATGARKTAGFTWQNFGVEFESGV